MIAKRPADIEIAEQQLARSRLKLENIKNRLDVAGVRRQPEYSELLAKTLAQAEHHLQALGSGLEDMKKGKFESNEKAVSDFDRCRDDFAQSIKNVIARLS